jgi:hypothetical protein
MDKKHRIFRKGAASPLARAAASAEARLIQQGPVRSYRVAAVTGPAFMLPDKGPANGGESAVLQLPAATPPRPGRKPGGPKRDGR